MKIGVLIAGVNSDVSADNCAELNAKFEWLKGIGIDNCQINFGNAEGYTEENARLIKECAEKHGVEITALWCGAACGYGPCDWGHYYGPTTNGIVPPEYRQMRVEVLKKGARFAKAMGITDVIYHSGFIPEYPASTEFKSFIGCMKYLAGYYKSLGMRYLFETGQETPLTLLRTIVEIGTGNVGINLDPSNLITDGKGNPVDALKTFGKYVWGIHAKDGTIPTEEDYIHGGYQCRIGEGDVDFPALINKLKEIGYDGALTIEREDASEEQKRIDIIDAKAYLEELI